MQEKLINFEFNKETGAVSILKLREYTDGVSESVHWRCVIPAGDSKTLAKHLTAKQVTEIKTLWTPEMIEAANAKAD